MKEPGLYTFCKIYVSDAMLEIAIKQPELKQACIEWYVNLITFATEKLPEVQYIDGLLAGFLTSYVVELHATELLPKLKAMYDTGCVNQMQSGNFESVERDISDLSITPYVDYAKYNIHEQFAFLKSHFD